MSNAQPVAVPPAGTAASGARIARSGGLGMLSTLIQMLAAAISLPLLLSRLGTTGFGVWAVAQILITYAAAADAGISPSIARYTAFYSGRDDLATISRILWTGILVYATFGVAALALGFLLAPALVDVFSIPAAYADDAQTMFVVTAGCVGLVMLNAGLAAGLQGRGRFGLVTTSSAVIAAAYLAGIALFIHEGDIVLLPIVYAASQCVGLVARLGALRAELRPTRPFLVTGALRRELIGFSGRMQVGTASALVNEQSDRVVIGLLSTPLIVGQFAIAAQLSAMARAVASATMSPIVQEFSRAHAAGDAVAHSAARVIRQWLLLLIGAGAIGLALLDPLIRAWLGDGHGKAVFFAALLTVSLLANLSTGPLTSYLRAINQLSLEVRYSLTIMALNVVATLALALAFGSDGVVVGTVIAYGVAAALLWVQFHRRHRDIAMPGVRDLVPALLLAAVAAGIAWAAARGIDAAVDGAVALVPLLAVFVALLGAYCVATHIVPASAIAARLRRT